ncbi:MULTISPECIES: glycosyltransferase family 2 protein [unclassified Ectothiorhodospira]|uniref:glycosyltransferase family 2 protein n=1 Tax=unclassified Ectothiorhodospira TaxID=2684909 RepID=UPI001EE7FAF5|nr:MULTISPECIES: glycosyltransferase family 2 protein [unclassified Ectothiorhodospira]MCG5517096.1 glycosyltransferase [Ectothiorhodospira sp. 9100]MCG5519758.1 glycosyltransferase [Ectothiorhodospira sp. 9905]
MHQDPPRIAIVIPFFQRKAGLLTQCVRSILEQPGEVGYQIIVVDDGSPISVDGELAPLLDEAGERLTIVRQPNSGPGAARNAGLDHVPEDTPFVTFLDSDDQWTGPFLTDAVHAMEQGYDLFMGNSARAGQEKTRFEWEADKGMDLKPKDHPIIDAERGIHAFQGDFFDLLVRRTSLVSTTVFAYQFARFSHVRFDPTIFNGQDRLFKLTLGQHLEKVAFSPRVYAHEGEGVNIFDKSQWGSEGSVRLVSSYIRLAKAILRQINLTSSQEEYVRGQLSDARHAFLASLLHLVHRRMPVDWPLVLATLREDPATLLLLPANLLRIFRNKTVA